MMRLWKVCCLFAVCLAATAQSREAHVGSEATIWNQRNAVQKIAFLEGLCQGLAVQGRSRLSDFTCESSALDGGGTRFCFLVNSDRPSRAVAFVDLFYAEKYQTEIPLWAVVEAYNDKACKEDAVTSKLPKMQKRNECLRQEINMFSSPGISAEARQAQKAHCEALKF